MESKQEELLKTIDKLEVCVRNKLLLATGENGILEELAISRNCEGVAGMNVEQELQKAIVYTSTHTREETENYLVKELEKCEYGSEEYNEWLEILNHVLNV